MTERKTITMAGQELEVIDWTELSRRGLLERINREICHPLGLAVFRDTETGVSGGAIVAPEGQQFCFASEEAQPT